MSPDVPEICLNPERELENETMVPNPAIINAVEQLDYRVTVGDVATKAGLNVATVEQGLLAIATEAGGHMQVTDTGDLVYLFPKNLRGVLRSRSLKLRLQETWQKIWRVLFYIIRISFGTILIASIILIFLAIVAISIAASNNRDEDNRGGGGGGMIFMPRFSPFDLFWIYDFGGQPRQRRDRDYRGGNRGAGGESELNFLEAVFSFLFGDGNPNAAIDERRWQAIGSVIEANGGAVVAEQIAPYMDDLGADPDDEDYMLPVLLRFNGKPEVSPEGDLVYHFPELQVRAAASSRTLNPTAQTGYLQEKSWPFSRAESGQLVMAAGLGVVNLVGAIVLGAMLGDGTIAAELGGLVSFVDAIYGVLLVYGTAFLAVPTLRFFWLKGYNAKVETRNTQRKAQAKALIAKQMQIAPKLTFAQQFANTQTISEDDLAYTTETDLVTQELENPDRVEAEWKRRLESGSSN
jgi:hypothetical protein